MVDQDALPVELTFTNDISNIIPVNNTDRVKLIVIPVSGAAGEVFFRTANDKNRIDPWPADGSVLYGAVAGVEAHDSFPVQTSFFKVERPAASTVRVLYQRGRDR